MSKYIAIPGNHWELSLAELISRFSDLHLQFHSPTAFLFESDEEFSQELFNSLGGLIKIAKVTDEINPSDLTETLAARVSEKDQGSMIDYGVSVYGMPERNLHSILLNLKKMLKAGGVKSRFANSTFQNITAAQYKSLRNRGGEWIVLKSGNTLYIGQTAAIQDIDAYSFRDYEKPFRDMKMGMLPPKLAQILINLTGARGAIWDPFCGSGAILTEGLLMGRDMVGSDIHPDRVAGAQKNVQWLRTHFRIDNVSEITIHDATQPRSIKNIEAITSETDLGLPHSPYIRADHLEKIINDLHFLYLDFFQNLKEMGFKGPIVMALPFFRNANGTERHMDETIRAIEDLGFRPQSLLPEDIKKQCVRLQYSRPDQAVGRMVYRFVLAKN